MKTPIVIVSVKDGKATAHAFNGAWCMVIDWDDLNAEANKREEVFHNVQNMISTVESYVPNSATKADLLSDLKQTADQIKERI